MLVLLLACAPDPEAVFLPPDQPGPWVVGADNDRVEGPDGLSLPLEIWFPAASADETLWAYEDLFTSAAREGGVPDCAEPRPVVMFSHGNGGVRFQSWFFTEHLASHGYLVAAPDHVGNTAFDLGEVPHSRLIERRPLDIVAAYEHLLARAQNTTDPLYGCVDPDAGYIMSGHSFGGFTTFALAGAALELEASRTLCADEGGWLCEDLETWAAEHPDQAELDGADDRVFAALPMSPAGYEVLVGGLDRVEAPLMLLSGLDDTLTPWEAQAQRLYGGLPGRRALVGIAGAGHYSFSNACELLPAYEDCDPPYLPPAEVHALTNAAATAFLGTVLHPELAEQYAPWLPAEDARLVWEDAL